MAAEASAIEIRDQNLHDQEWNHNTSAAPDANKVKIIWTSTFKVLNLKNKWAQEFCSYKTCVPFLLFKLITTLTCLWKNKYAKVSQKSEIKANLQTCKGAELTQEADATPQLHHGDELSFSLSLLLFFSQI